MQTIVPHPVVLEACMLAKQFVGLHQKAIMPTYPLFHTTEQRSTRPVWVLIDRAVDAEPYLKYPWLYDRGVLMRLVNNIPSIPLLRGDEHIDDAFVLNFALRVISAFTHTDPIQPQDNRED